MQLRTGLVGLGKHGLRYAKHIHGHVPGLQLAAVWRDRRVGEEGLRPGGARPCPGPRLRAPPIRRAPDPGRRARALLRAHRARRLPRSPPGVPAGGGDRRGEPAPRGGVALAREKPRLLFREKPRSFLVHTHCYQKALGGAETVAGALALIPGAHVETIDAGCCGMAGAFGFEAEHHEVSQAIAGERLLPAIRARARGTLLVAGGTTRRQQIRHLRVLIGEIYALPNPELVKYYGANLDECHLPFNFGLIWIPWTLETVREKIEAYEAALPPGAWPNWVLGNHDQPRIATRAGREQARLATMLLLTLRGTPTYYNGDEIGMENVPIPLDMLQDPPAVNQPELAHLLGRDPERTPMLWDSLPNAGFTAAGVRPWLPLADNYKMVNVESQLKDKRSFLNFFRALMDYRKASPALKVGSYRSLDLKSEEALVPTSPV